MKPMKLWNGMTQIKLLTSLVIMKYRSTEFIQFTQILISRNACFLYINIKYI